MHGPSHMDASCRLQDEVPSDLLRAITPHLLDAGRDFSKAADASTLQALTSLEHLLQLHHHCYFRQLASANSTEAPADAAGCSLDPNLIPHTACIWGPVVWRMLMAGYVRGREAVLDMGAAEHLSKLCSCAASCAQLMVPFIAGEPAITDSLVKDLEDGYVLGGMADILQATLRSVSDLAPPHQQQLCPHDVTWSLTVVRSWALVVQLLGVSFVNSPKTGQHLLDLMKPVFSPKQCRTVRQEGYNAWVQLAASMASSGCVHKASRYKLLVQPLRHALLYDNEVGMREVALQAWCRVVCVLRLEDPAAGQAGARAAGSAACPTTSPPANAADQQAKAPSSGRPWPQTAEMPWLDSLCAAGSSVCGEDIYLWPGWHAAPGHATSVSVPQEAWNYVVDPIVRIVLGIDSSSAKSRGANMPAVQRCLLTLLLPMLRRLCSCENLGYLLSLLNTALDAGSLSLAIRSADTSLAALAPLGEGIHLPGIRAEPWLPPHAFCWADLIVAMFAVLLKCLAAADRARPQSVAGRDGPQEGVDNSQELARKELLVSYMHLVMHILNSLADASKAVVALKIEGLSDSQQTAGSRGSAASAAPAGPPDGKNASGVGTGWALFAQASCRISQLTATYAATGTPPAFAALLDDVLEADPDLPGASSHPAAGARAALEAVPGVGPGLPRLTPNSGVHTALVLAMSLQRRIMMKAGPGQLHSAPRDASVEPGPAMSPARRESSRTIWLQLLRSWMGMLGPRCDLLVAEDWIEGVADLALAAGKGKVDLCNFNVMLSTLQTQLANVDRRLGPRSHAMLGVWLVVSEHLSTCMGPVLSDCSNRTQRAAAEGAVMDVLLYGCKWLSAAEKQHQDSWLRQQQQQQQDPLVDKREGGAGEGGGAAQRLVEGDAAALCSKMSTEWCRCFRLLNSEINKRMEHIIEPLLGLPRSLIHAFMLRAADLFMRGASLSAASAIAACTCDWLVSIAGISQKPSLLEPNGSVYRRPELASGSGSWGPTRGGNTPTPPRSSSAAPTTPLPAASGSAAMWVGPESRRPEKGGVGGSSRGPGELAGLVAASLLEGCWLAGSLLQAAVQGVVEAALQGDVKEPIWTAAMLQGSPGQALAMSAGALAALAAAGPASSSVPVVLGAGVMVDVLAADGRAGGWGSALQLAFEHVVPALAAAFPQELEEQFRDEQLRGRSTAGQDIGRLVDMGEEAKEQGRECKPGAGQVAMKLLLAWRACLKGVAQLRWHGCAVQACVDALEGALAAALRCGVPAFSKVTDNFLQSIVTSADGAPDGRAGSAIGRELVRRLDYSVPTSGAPGPPVALPARVLQAMDDMGPPRDSPDDEAAAMLRAIVLPGPAPSAQVTPHRPSTKKLNEDGVGGSKRAPAKGTTPLPSRVPPSRKPAINAFGAASQTEYVRIPSAGPRQTDVGASRPKRAQGLMTYTSLDASQAPLDVFGSEGSAEPSQQQQELAVMADAGAKPPVPLESAIRGAGSEPALTGGPPGGGEGDASAWGHESSAEEEVLVSDGAGNGDDEPMESVEPEGGAEGRLTNGAIEGGLSNVRPALDAADDLVAGAGMWEGVRGPSAVPTHRAADKGLAGGLAGCSSDAGGADEGLAGGLPVCPSEAGGQPIHSAGPGVGASPACVPAIALAPEDPLGVNVVRPGGRPLAASDGFPAPPEEERRASAIVTRPYGVLMAALMLNGPRRIHQPEAGAPACLRPESSVGYVAGSVEAGQGESHAAPTDMDLPGAAGTEDRLPAGPLAAVPGPSGTRPTLQAPEAAALAESQEWCHVDDTQKVMCDIQASRCRVGKLPRPAGPTARQQLSAAGGRPASGVEALQLPRSAAAPTDSSPEVGSDAVPDGAGSAAAREVDVVDPGGHLPQACTKRRLEGGEPCAKRVALGDVSVGDEPLAATFPSLGDGGQRGANGGTNVSAAFMTELQSLAARPASVWEDFEVDDIRSAQAALMGLLQASHSAMAESLTKLR